MPPNASDVAKYLEFSLLQLGAESYLHDVNFANQGQVVNAWKFGFNDFTHKFIAETLSTTPDSTTLPGYNRMVQTQGDALFGRWEVVDHHSNDSTGFSATIYRARANDPVTGVLKDSYVLSMRSTEFRPEALAGDQTNGSRVAFPPRFRDFDSDPNCSG